MPQLTERQTPALAEMVKRAEGDYGVIDIMPWSENAPYWLTKFHAETRPGRGHAFEAIYCDGENLVVIRLDPYGAGSLEVARLNWVHTDADEECPCPDCVADRSEDE